MKFLLYFISLLFIVSSFTNPKPINPCDPIRYRPSEMIKHCEVVKGYFIPKKYKNERVAKFRVVESSTEGIRLGIYNVAEHGPFGDRCQIKILMVKPLEDKFCGEQNMRYIFIYKRNSVTNLVSPRFFAEGLIIKNNTVTDDFGEYTDVSVFEDYVFNNSKVSPKWRDLAHVNSKGANKGR